MPRTLTPNDLKVLQKRMKKSVKKNLAITGEQISKKDAKKIFASQPYKLELIEDIEEETVGHFTHGDFEDLLLFISPSFIVWVDASELCPV